MATPSETTNSTSSEGTLPSPGHRTVTTAVSSSSSTSDSRTDSQRAGDRWPENGSPSSSPPSSESYLARTSSVTSSASTTSAATMHRKKTLRQLRAKTKDEIIAVHSAASISGEAGSKTTSMDLSQITVESKITSAQLQKVKSKRKTISRDAKKDKISISQARRPSLAPMPDESLVDRQFTAILQAMDLSEEQLSHLESYSMEKKWSMICDSAPQDTDMKHTPRYLTDKLWSVLKDRNYKDANQLIKTMEILLRSSQINWLNVFLSPSVDGLSAVMTLLDTLQVIVRNEKTRVMGKEEREKSHDTRAERNKFLGLQASKKWQRSSSAQALPTFSQVQPSETPGSPGSTRGTPLFKVATSRLRRHRFSTGDIGSLSLPFDYVTLAHDIMLLTRAIMNTEVGFTAVVGHKTALNLIAACLFDTQAKTRLLVLEMLTVACMLEGAHRRVVEAMDYNRKTYNEEYRFFTLVQQFKDPPNTLSQDYLCASLNFFNVIVHSASNLNLRVHLQYDLTALGFDEALGAHRSNPNLEPLLEKQINAYVDNFVDVQSLIEGYENPKNVANEDTKLENQRLREELANNETRYVAKIAELEANLRDMRRSIEMLMEVEGRVSHSASNKSISLLPPPPAVVQKPPSSFAVTAESEPVAVEVSPSSPVEKQAPVSPTSTDAPPEETTDGQGESPVAAAAATTDVTESKSTPAAPPPPPPPAIGAGPAPPPPPGMMIKQTQQRKAVKTKYKLPALNWQILHKSSWTSTVFAAVDPDFYQSLDMADFEESFKLKVQPNEEQMDVTASRRLRSQTGVVTPKVLDNNICKNVGILQKKLGVPAKELVEKITSYQYVGWDSDILEQLAKFNPSTTEIQKFERLEKNNTISTLTSQEQFIWELYRVPRFHAKLRSVVYMLNFHATVAFIQPQLQAVYVAGTSVTGSQSLKKMFELIMAFGNYANSGRRGWTGGFQITSLDSLKSMKSTDGSRTLVHYIADVIKDRKEYNNIFNELIGLDRAAQVVLSQLTGEISQLVNGLMLLRAEDKKEASSQADLSKFLDHARQTVPDLERLSRGAQEAFEEAMVYLGESVKTQTPAEIFGPLARFLKNLKAAESQNEAARKQAAEAEKKRQNGVPDKVVKRQMSLGSAHREMADQLEDILNKGNALKMGRPASGSGFIDDIYQASKVVAYRAGVGSAR